MSSISALISSIRPLINDTQSVGYQDPELTDRVNEGIMHLRGIVSSLKPKLIMEPAFTGSTSGETITFPNNFLKIISVRLNNRKIYEVLEKQHQRGDYDYDSTVMLDSYASDYAGCRRFAYMIEGFNTIRITPPPAQAYPFEITYVAAMTTPLTGNADSGWTMEYERLIKEYAVARSALRNNADSGEAALVAALTKGVEEIIGGMSTRRSVVKGYRGR
ncbi:MAG: hypothetical protein P4N59_03395 [Negativicutes bacterium]|nr:hypothetical protein [Negativicutes bacterium]